MDSSIRQKYSSRRNWDVVIILGVLLILSGIMTFVLSKLSGISLKEAFYLSCFLWALLLTIFFGVKRVQDRKKAGPLVDDLVWIDSSEIKSLRWTSVVLLLNGLFFLIIGLAEGESREILLSALFLPPALMSLQYFRIGYQIRQNGLLTDNGLFNWASITDFEWDNLQLTLLTTGIIFRDCQVTVPEAKKDAVEKIIRDQLRNTTSG